MTNAEIAVLATLIAYKISLLAVGLWAARLNRTETDFYLGGRAMGPWVAGLSYVASTSSAWVLLGFSGFVYTQGLAALWMVPGILGAYVAMWVWIGRRMRADSASEDQLTLSDFLAARAGPAGRRVIVSLAACLVLFCFIFYIAAQFGAAALAFESQFALGRTQSVLIGAAVILAYSLIGGFWAVSVTDMIQGVMMALLAVGLPTLAVIAAGGPAEIVRALAETEPAAYLSITGGQGVFVFIGFALGVAGIGLGTFGQPQLFSRLMALKSDAARRQGFAVAMVWGLLVYAGMSAMALAGRALTGGAVEGEALLYALAGDLLPAVFAGIVIAAVLSAVMSTVDSLLIATSAAVTRDLGVARRFPGREVMISRVVMGVLCVLAALMALAVPATIFDRVLFSWSALGAAFGPIVFARIARVEPASGAIVLAMIAGFAMSALFFLVRVSDAGGPLGALAALPGAPFERVVPWIVPLVLVFAWRRPRAVRASV